MSRCSSSSSSPCWSFYMWWHPRGRCPEGDDHAAWDNAIYLTVLLKSFFQSIHFDCWAFLIYTLLPISSPPLCIAVITDYLALFTRHAFPKLKAL
jgi:hypothetical protein